MQKFRFQQVIVDRFMNLSSSKKDIAVIPPRSPKVLLESQKRCSAETLQGVLWTEAGLLQLELSQYLSVG